MVAVAHDNVRRSAALFLSVLFSAPPLRAQTDQATIVLLTSQDPSSAQSETLTAIRAQISDLPVHVVIERREQNADIRVQLDTATRLAAAHRARGVFWLDVDTQGDALLYFLDAAGSRLLLRRIHHDDADKDTAAVTEEIANITRANVAALAEGREIGMLPVTLPTVAPLAPQRAAPIAPPPIVERHRVQLGIEFAYVGSAWAASVPWQSGFGLGAELQHHSGFAARATFTFFPTATISAEGSTIELSRHPIELAIAWDAHISRLDVGAELGGIVDPVTRDTSQVASGFQPTPSETNVTFALSPKMRLGVRPWSWLRVFGRAGIDVYVVQNDYAVSGQVSLLSPHRVRGRFDIGIDVIAW